MMLRTHLAITILAVLLFLPSISNKIVFAIVAVIATYLPDADTGFSTFGKSSVGTFTRFFTRHRGILHSFTFCIPLAFVFAWFVPIIALPFFLAYSLHIFTDSFTREGVKPFWPMKFESKGFFYTGGTTESTGFLVLLVANLILFIIQFNRIFS